MEERTYTQAIDEEALSYYTELNNRLNTEGDNFDYVMNHMPPRHANTDAYIKDYVRNLSSDELKARADGLIKAQNLKENHGLIDYMSEKPRDNFSQYRSQFSPIMWQAHEKDNNQTIKIGEKIVNSGDLDYSIAESLEIQDAHTDPRAEYYEWCRNGNRIASDLTTNGATCDEILQRNMFIDFMERRETEIKRIATLYSAAALNPNSPLQQLAQEKLNFTLFKLSELRRLRDKMKSTKSTADFCKHDPAQQRQQQEHKNNKPTYIFSPVAKDDNDLSLGEKRLSEMYASHELNQGFSERFTHFRPDTQNHDQAIKKMDLAVNNHNVMREMLQAMRNGMSREEWLKKHQQAQTPNNNRRSLRGFSIERYNEALRDLNK